MQLATPSPEWITWITKTELNLEFSISIFCFFCNLYFSVRFAQIPNFDSDLKTVFIILHISKAFLAIIHPLAEMFPPEWTDIESGNYFAVFCYYFLQYLFSICIYLISIEITMLVLERKLAVHQIYSKGKKFTGKQVLCSAIAIISIGILLKDIFMYIAYKNERPLKIMLDKVFILDKYPPVQIFAYTSCVCSCAYGLVEFIRLRRFIRKHWYAGRTLAEAIKIKQTGTLTKVLLPIAISYFICAILAGLVYFWSLYMHYFLGFSLYSPALNAFIYAQYVCAAIYNLFATCYIIWLLKPMRKLMIQDLHRLMCMQRKHRRICPSAIDYVREREHHFSYLKKAWQ